MYEIHYNKGVCYKDEKSPRSIISKEKAIVTYNGKPIAMIKPLSEENWDNVMSETTAIYGGRNRSELIKFKEAVLAIRKEAMKKGITEKDVDEAIAAVRKEARKNK